MRGCETEGGRGREQGSRGERDGRKTDAGRDGVEWSEGVQGVEHGIDRQREGH